MRENEMDSEKSLIVFQDKKIRRLWHNDEWHFSVSDIIAILTDSKDELAYWRKLKQREPQLVTICHGLKLPAKDGKLRYADCVNTRNAFRLIQSIPSLKAEPFKQWLAKVGYERIQEIENPELAQDRVKDYYELKGYPADWIEKRLRGINQAGFVSTSKIRVKCIFGLSKSIALAGFRFQKGVSYPWI